MGTGIQDVVSVISEFKYDHYFDPVTANGFLLKGAPTTAISHLKGFLDLVSSPVAIVGKM